LKVLPDHGEERLTDSPRGGADVVADRAGHRPTSSYAACNSNHRLNRPHRRV
jgi:hypothetical protein